MPIVIWQTKPFPNYNVSAATGVGVLSIGLGCILSGIVREGGCINCVNISDTDILFACLHFLASFFPFCY